MFTSYITSSCSLTPTCALDFPVPSFFKILSYLICGFVLDCQVYDPKLFYLLQRVLSRPLAPFICLKSVSTDLMFKWICNKIQARRVCVNSTKLVVRLSIMLSLIRSRWLDVCTTLFTDWAALHVCHACAKMSYSTIVNTSNLPIKVCLSVYCHY
jgi:hypothetical protein